MGRCGGGAWRAVATRPGGRRIASRTTGDDSRPVPHQERREGRISLSGCIALADWNTEHRHSSIQKNLPLYIIPPTIPRPTPLYPPCAPHHAIGRHGRGLGGQIIDDDVQWLVPDETRQVQGAGGGRDKGPVQQIEYTTREAEAVGAVQADQGLRGQGEKGKGRQAGGLGGGRGRREEGYRVGGCPEMGEDVG